MLQPSLPISVIGISFCCGIVLREMVTDSPSFTMVGFAFVFMWLSHIKRWQIVFWSAVVGAFVLLGMIRHVPIKNKEANHEKQIVVMVQKPLNTNSFGHQYIVKNQDDNERLLLQTPLSQTFLIGDRLLTQGSLVPIPKPKNPVDFDFKTYMNQKGVVRKIIASHDERILLPPQQSLRRWAHQTQRKLVQQLNKLPIHLESKALIMALVLGEKRDLSEERIAQYQRAGAMHLLAISGLHIGILLLLFRTIVSPLKRFRYGSVAVVLLPVVLLWCFAFVSGASASVTRAVTMFSFLQLGLGLNRKLIRMQSLWASFFILLFIQPKFIFDVGFQLSYSAVLGIVWMLPYWQKMVRSKNTIIQPISTLFGLGLIAQISVLPLSLFYFHQFPLLFWVSNLLLVPLIGVVIGVGIGCLVISFFPALYFLLPIADWVLRSYLHLVAWIAQWEHFFLTEIPFRSLDAVLLGLVVLALFYFAQKPTKYKAITLGVLSLVFHLFLFIEYPKLPRGYVAHTYQNTLIVTNSEAVLRTYHGTKTKGIIELAQKFKQKYRLDSIAYQPLKQGYKNVLFVDSLGIYTKGGGSSLWWSFDRAPKYTSMI